MSYLLSALGSIGLQPGGFPRHRQLKITVKLYHYLERIL